MSWDGRGDSMKPLVLYHSNCSDGFAAAWCAYRRFGADAEYRAVNYGDDPPADLLHGRDVYILDFSYLPEFIDMMATQATRLVLLDHHQSALEGFTEAWGAPRVVSDHLGKPLDGVSAWNRGVCDVLIDQARSGAQIAWDWFTRPAPEQPKAQPRADRPWLIDYVADRDLWRWKLPQSREVNAYLRSLPQDFRAWDRLVETGEDSEATATMLEASLAHYESILRAVTPGPWFVRVVGPDDHKTIMVVGPPGSGGWQKAPEQPLVIAEMRLPTVSSSEIHANWDLMATARTAIPDLVAEIRKAQRTPVQVAATLGTAILSAQAREIERAVRRARPMKIMIPDRLINDKPRGVQAILDVYRNDAQPFIVNTTENVSEVLEQLAKQPPHWAVGWYQAEDGRYRYSLRSSPEGPDVAKIAEAWGGGGHRHAAGFETKRMVF